MEIGFPNINQWWSRLQLCEYFYHGHDILCYAKWVDVGVINHPQYEYKLYWFGLIKFLSYVNYHCIDRQSWYFEFDKILL